MKYVKLGEMLVASKTISTEQLNQALAAQTGTKKRLGIILQELGFITESQLIEVLCKQLNVEYVDLNAIDIPPELATIVPKNVAVSHSLLPISYNNKDICLAMSDPLNFVAVDEVKKISRRNVKVFISEKFAIEHAIQNLYSNQGAMRALNEMQDNSALHQNIAVVDTLTVDEDADSASAPAAKFVNAVIARACQEKASDVHIEPGEEVMNVRMRVDGLLRNVLTVPKELQGAVISRFKIIGGMDIAKRFLPQDGHAKITCNGEMMDLRVSSVPTVYGEKVVIRLLRAATGLATFEGVGIRGANLKTFMQMLNGFSEGVILVVGPTGSGKTSTLYTIIRKLKSSDINLISVEDPVEYNMPGVCQIPVNEKTGLTFAVALRSILRQDPDIISVGEIRDAETAEIAMRAAMTGHMVFSTVHTNSAISSIDRLLDIGIEPYLITGAVKGIISQRLVRRICPKCKKAYQPTAEEMISVGIKPKQGLPFYKGEGCNDCFHTGFKGRIGVFEILSLNSAMKDAIHSRSLSQLENAVKASGFRTIWDDCRDLVVEGITSVSEIQRVMGIHYHN